MTAAARRRQRSGDESLDVELPDLPAAARWREWMLRVEAAIFASPKPVACEALVRLVGETCRFDDLIADLIHELRGRAYDLTLVAGGYALRTKPRFAPAIRAAHPGLGGDNVAELTRTETFALTAIAYLQPATRGEISKLAGREISRDVIGALKRHGLIDGAIRAPQAGAPFAYVTTKRFLEAFGFASLRDLPDLERLKAGGLMETRREADDLDNALGLADDEVIADEVELNAASRLGRSGPVSIRSVESARASIATRRGGMIVEPTFHLTAQRADVVKTQTPLRVSGRGDTTCARKRA